MTENNLPQTGRLIRTPTH